MSCSQRKIEANRLNATKSTGPKTTEGKARSSQNALKHGLTARTPVVLEESADEFRAFAEALLADLRPRGAMQQVLVERIIVISWKLRRVPAAEESVIRQQAQTARGNQRGADDYLAGPLPEPSAGQIVAADVACSHSELTHLQMYEMRLERALHACLRQLRQLKKMQRDEDEETEQNEPTDDGPAHHEREEAIMQNEPTPTAAPIIPPQANCADCVREMPAVRSHPLDAFTFLDARRQTTTPTPECEP